MQQSISERGRIERREAGPGQSSGEHGHIERICGRDVTRGDMLAEAEAVGGRVGSRRSPGVKQLAGGRH